MSARDRQTLPLTARQIGRAFLEDRRIALRQPLDEFVCAGELGNSHDLVQRGGRLGHCDVLAHRAAEQEILLQDDTDLGAQVGQIELLQILAVDVHEAGLRAMRPWMRRVIVVLPEPLRPTMPTIWPGSTVNEISLTAGVGDPG
jgi:hypothetical protein